jgi:hypothetical protein
MDIKIDPDKDFLVLGKYERMLVKLYAEYAEEKKSGRAPKKDGELYKKIIRGRMLITEWKRQRACNIY